jgi:hypothetical protein
LDAALRLNRMRVGTRVFVDEGTARGLSGCRTTPLFCGHLEPQQWLQLRFEAFRGATARASRTCVRPVFSKSTFWLDDTAQWSRWEISSQHKETKVQGDRDQVYLEKALAQAKKDYAAMLKKQKTCHKRELVFTAEREVFPAP